MDSDYADTLGLTQDVAETFQRLIQAGVRDPCVHGGVDQTTCRLWHRLHPKNTHLRAKISEAQEIIKKRKKDSEIVGLLQEYRKSELLDNYLGDWLCVTRNAIIVEAVLEVVVGCLRRSFQYERCTSTMHQQVRSFPKPVSFDASAVGVQG